MRAVGISAAFSLLVAPGIAHARDDLAALIAQLNGMVRSEKTTYALTVAGQVENRTLVLDSTSKIDGKHLRYSVAASDLNLNKIYWAPDNTILVECLANARCVSSTDVATGQRLVSFDYISVGPFSATTADRENALGVVKQMVTLAKATRQ
jgi:hypothetical protein